MCACKADREEADRRRLRSGIFAGRMEMGMVISFPVSARPAVRLESGRCGEAGQVVILPVIRIERFSEQPAMDSDTGARRAPARKRRRRATRS